MHASPQVRDVILANKMRHWLGVIRQPLSDKRCSTSRARRNFLKLVRKHRSLAASLGLSEMSAFDSESPR